MSDIERDPDARHWRKMERILMKYQGMTRKQAREEIRLCKEDERRDLGLADQSDVA